MAKNTVTDKRNRFDSMKLHSRSSVLLLVALGISGNAALAQTMTDASLATRPLNLSLPRDALWFATVRNDSGLAFPRQEAPNLPDLGTRTRDGAGARGSLPYGSGYEARQHGGGTGHAGTGFGGGHGGGGMGRRR